MSIHDSIIRLLNEKNVPFRTVNHQPTTTSEESAAARGESVAVGGKALLIKADETFCLCVISAARKVDSKKLKQQLAAKSIRFATREELLERTGLLPGSVPPFGRPILPFDLYIDASIAANDTIAFNAGSLTDSIIMNRSDYTAVAGGTLLQFSADENGTSKDSL